jgi:hypothetical protein
VINCENISHPELSFRIDYSGEFYKFLDLFSSLLFVLIQKVTEASVAKKSRNPETCRATFATLKQRDFAGLQICPIFQRIVKGIDDVRLSEF